MRSKILLPGGLGPCVALTMLRETSGEFAKLALNLGKWLSRFSLFAMVLEIPYKLFLASIVLTCFDLAKPGSNVWFALSLIN